LRFRCWSFRLSAPAALFLAGCRCRCISGPPSELCRTLMSDWIWVYQLGFALAVILWLFLGGGLISRGDNIRPIGYAEKRLTALAGGISWTRHVFQEDSPVFPLGKGPERHRRLAALLSLSVHLFCAWNNFVFALISGFPPTSTPSHQSARLGLL